MKIVSFTVLGLIKNCICIMKKKPLKKGKQKPVKHLEPTSQNITTKPDIKEIYSTKACTSKASDPSLPSTGSSQECTILSPVSSSLTSESSETDFEFSPETTEELRRYIDCKQFVSEERRAQLWREICEENITTE